MTPPSDFRVDGIAPVMPAVRGVEPPKEQAERRRRGRRRAEKPVDDVVLDESIPDAIGYGQNGRPATRAIQAGKAADDSKQTTKSQRTKMIRAHRPSGDRAESHFEG